MYLFTVAQLRVGIRTANVQAGLARAISFVEPGEHAGPDVLVAGSARRPGRPVRTQSGGPHLSRRRVRFDAV